MKTHLSSSLLMLLFGALFILATPLHGQAQYFRLAINEIEAVKADDDDCLPLACDKDDEIYFVVTGFTSHDGIVGVPKVTPAGADNFSISTGQKLRDIPLWNGHWYYLGEGETANFEVAVRNGTWINLDVLSSITQVAGITLATIISGSPNVLGELGSALTAFANALSNDGDHNIAFYAVSITNQNNKFIATWKAGNQTTLQSSNHMAARFTANGYGSNYDLKVSVQRSAASLSNKLSNKCLDVAGASLADQANVQQYSCHGGQNQQWVFKPMGYLEKVAPDYSIINAYSGKCLDVAGASLADGANVQQYACHGGDNQIWKLDNLFDGTHRIRNLRSGKALEVAGGSVANGGNVQQFMWKNGDNQKWRINW